MSNHDAAMKEESKDTPEESNDLGSVNRDRGFSFYASENFKAKPDNHQPQFRGRVTLEDGDDRPVDLFVNKTKRGTVLTTAAGSENTEGSILDRIAAKAETKELEIKELGLRIRPGQAVLFENDKGGIESRKDFRGFYLAGATADTLHSIDVWAHERAPSKPGHKGALYLSGPVKKVDLDKVRAQRQKRQSEKAKA